MTLLIFRSLWTNGFDLAAALDDVAAGGFDGIEGPLPAAPEARASFVDRLTGSGVPFIAEIATGGGYVPTDRDPVRHLAQLGRQLDLVSGVGARFATALAGCDGWPLPATVDFLGAAVELARQRGVALAFETHRSRPTFTPWATAELLRQVPALRLTCDFSHWCCVCERLVLDDEPELLDLFARRAAHIHARVGYAQGPQVPHPAAAEYRDALRAHERWWDVVMDARLAAGETDITLTPEFGPDGYLQSAPFTEQPVASLDEINRWMADRLRRRFDLRADATGAASSPASCTIDPGGPDEA